MGGGVGTQASQFGNSGTGKFGGMAGQQGGSNPFQQYQGMGAQQASSGNSYYPQTQQQAPQAGAGKYGGMTGQQSVPQGVPPEVSQQYQQQRPFQAQQPNYGALFSSLASMFGGQQSRAPFSNYQPVQSANNFQLRNTYQFDPATDPSRQYAARVKAEAEQKEAEAAAAKAAADAAAQSQTQQTSYEMGSPGNARGGRINGGDKKIRAALLTAKGVQAKAVPEKSEGGDVTSGDNFKSNPLSKLNNGISAVALKSYLDHHNIPFTVKHSQNFSNTHGPSASSYYIIPAPLGPHTIRLSDHDYIDAENQTDLRYNMDPSDAELRLADSLGLPLSERAAQRKKEKESQATAKKLRDQQMGLREFIDHPKLGRGQIIGYTDKMTNVSFADRNAEFPNEFIHKLRHAGMPLTTAEGVQAKAVPSSHGIDNVHTVIDPATVDHPAADIPGIHLRAGRMGKAGGGELRSYRATMRGRMGQYDPNYYKAEEDPLHDEQGQIIATRDRLEPLENTSVRVPIEEKDEFYKGIGDTLYRGMSHEEYENFLKTGTIQSQGQYNIGDSQKGLTYFTTSPRTAESYANSFAPEKHKPTFERPAYIVAIKRPANEHIRQVKGTGEHEFGVTRPIKAYEVKEIYRGKVVAYDPGEGDSRNGVSPTAYLHWEKIKNNAPGKSGGGPLAAPGALIEEDGGRVGYAGGGGEDDPVVQKALGLTQGNPPSKSLFTQDVYHGTAGNFPEFRDDAGDYSMSRGLGVHVARDPIISSNPYFVNRNETGEGGNVLPLKTFPDNRFYEIHQPLHPYLPEETPKAPRTVRGDDVSVENEIMSHAFKHDKDLLKMTLMEQRQLSEADANEAVNKLHSGQPWVHHGQEVKNIDHLVKNYGLKPWNEHARKYAVKSFRDALIKQGYVGVKYINTSPNETENAKDPTCYIVFPEKGEEGVYPLRGRFAKFDPARAHEADIMSARGGGIGYANGGGRIGYGTGGGEDDPTVQKALSLTQQPQPMAQPDPSPIPGAMQVAQAVTAPGRRRFEIAPARVAPMTIDQKDRDLPEEGSVTIKRLTDAFKRAIDNHLSLPPAQQIANARQAENNVAKYVGRGKEGKMNSVLTANKKLMKAQTAGENNTPLTLPDGRTLEMTGLPLMPDYREGQFKMCGNSDVCRDLCLGKESGQYRYDKTATQTQIPTTKEEVAEAGNKPRMSAFRRTMAMMRDPESFAVYLYELIDGAKIMAERRGSHLGVRLNILSDLSPKIMEPIIKAHPEVSFYDYTKMNYDPIAPNHHYTYSSTGLSQPERGIENPFSNWRKLRDRLDQGHNVAMAFAHGKGDAFPEHLHDEETGKKYRVVSGDDHDFRPMDMVPEGEDGVIIALKNMAASNSKYKYENAARNSHGFFVHHEPNFEQTARGTFVRDENGNRISRSKIYNVSVQPMKRGVMRQKED